MKDRRIAFELLELYDWQGVERRLERQAAKGWRLEKIVSPFWYYRRTKPAQVRYAVTYLPNVGAAAAGNGRTPAPAGHPSNVETALDGPDVPPCRTAIPFAFVLLGRPGVRANTIHLARDALLRCAVPGI